MICTIVDLQLTADRPPVTGFLHVTGCSWCLVILWIKLVVCGAYETPCHFWLLDVSGILSGIVSVILINKESTCLIVCTSEHWQSVSF